MESKEPQRLKIHKIGAEAGKRGKEYEVRQAEEDFNGNVFNTVRKAEVAGAERGYSRSFVLRRPRLSFDGGAIKTEDDIKKQIRTIVTEIKKYQELKAAGLKHLPTTYQLGGIDERDPVIVMTDYTEGDAKIVLSNNTVGNGTMLESVENTDHLLAEITADIKAASDAGYFIPLDAYFFIVPVAGGRVEKMEFAIADLDQCHRSKDEDFNKNLFMRNMWEAKGALNLVLINHFKQDVPGRESFNRKVNEWCDRIKSAP